MFKIIDNSISKKDQKYIQQLLLDNKLFPWFFMKDVTSKSKKQSRPAFSHYFVINKKQNSSAVNNLKSIFKKYIKKEIIHFKSILQLPLNTRKVSYDTPHTDIEEPHTVYLYYVNDSDGETILFKDEKIHKKVKPKKGRMLVFDGKTLHAAYQPIKNIRCVLNINEAKQ